uniref:Uncharacterized protein n=1 Tax=viral metagenome TaxID=1070528 RepID=A0A6M3IS87_9ZZZZ
MRGFIPRDLSRADHPAGELRNGLPGNTEDKRMSDKTKIEWTNATWNPVTGCSVVSPGCVHCYAKTLAVGRLAGTPGYPGLSWTPENAAINVVLHPDRLDQPLRWRKPRRVFVCSMGDLFHELVPDGFIDKIFAAMMLTPQHTFQILTKRSERMAKWMTTQWGGVGEPWEDRGDAVRGATFEVSFMHAIALPEPWNWPLPNVWLGTSIENQRWADERVPLLLQTPAAVRFLSLEPLLGPLPSLDLTGIDWLIVGGESGQDYRNMDPEWVRDLADRASAADVLLFVKQSAGRFPGKQGNLPDDLWARKEYPRVVSKG